MRQPFSSQSRRDAYCSAEQLTKKKLRETLSLQMLVIIIFKHVGRICVCAIFSFATFGLGC